MFLVEVIINDKMQIIATKETKEEAVALVEEISPKEGLVTEMEIGKEYRRGIGVCSHWHYDSYHNDGDIGEWFE